MKIRKDNACEALSPGLAQSIHPINGDGNTSSSFVIVVVVLEIVVVIVVTVVMVTDMEVQERTVSMRSDGQERHHEGKHRGIRESSILEKMYF